MEVSYKHFCILGALTNPRCSTRTIKNGEHSSYRKYYYLSDAELPSGWKPYVRILSPILDKS